jgi:hypothetical protein
MQIEHVDIAADIWKNLVEYIPARDREAAAEQFVVALRRLDFTDEDFAQLAEVDHHIDDVLTLEAQEEEVFEQADDDEYQDTRY